MVEGVVIHLYVTISACRCWVSVQNENERHSEKNGRTVWAVQSSYCFVEEDAANLPKQ